MPSKGVVPLVSTLYRAYKESGLEIQRALVGKCGGKWPESELGVQMPCNPVTLCRNLCISFLHVEFVGRMGCVIKVG